MTSDGELDGPPISHAITNSWDDFAATILPGIGGDEHAEAHIAFHFGALSVLKIVQEVAAQRSDEEVTLALAMLDAELDEFMKAHAVAVQ